MVFRELIRVCFCVIWFLDVYFFYFFFIGGVLGVFEIEIFMLLIGCLIMFWFVIEV